MRMSWLPFYHVFTLSKAKEVCKTLKYSGKPYHSSNTPRDSNWHSYYDAKYFKRIQVQDLISSLKLLLYHSKCTKHELLSLINKLSLTCRIFLCWLIDTSCSVSLLHHYIRLTKKAHLDICLWLQFLPQWNGICCILQTIWTAAPAMGFYTDVSCIARVPTGLEGGYSHSSQLSISTMISHGRVLCNRAFPFPWQPKSLAILLNSLLQNGCLWGIVYGETARF